MPCLCWMRPEAVSACSSVWRIALQLFGQATTFRIRVDQVSGPLMGLDGTCMIFEVSNGWKLVDLLRVLWFVDICWHVWHFRSFSVSRVLAQVCYAVALNACSSGQLWLEALWLGCTEEVPQCCRVAVEDWGTPGMPGMQWIGVNVFGLFWICFCCLLLSFSQSILPFRRTPGTVLLSRSLLRAAGHVHSPTLRNDDLMMCFNTAMSWLDCETQGERWSLHTSWNLSWAQWNWAQRNSAKWLVHLSTMGFETRCCESQLTWTVSLEVLQDLLQAYTFHFLVDDCGLASHMWLEGTGGSRPEKLSITSSHLWLRKWYWTSVEESIG